MNRGKLILSPISSPKEGMQVYWEDPEGETSAIYTIDKISGDVISMTNKCSECEAYVSELNQIMIEYEDIKITGSAESWWKKYILPLHPSDWEYALGYIGEEVEFKSIYEGDRSSVKLSEEFVYAKLILPSKESIVYSEEEVFNLVSKYRGEWGLFLADYWKEHGKTSPEVVFKEWFEQNKKK